MADDEEQGPGEENSIADEGKDVPASVEDQMARAEAAVDATDAPTPPKVEEATPPTPTPVNEQPPPVLSQNELTAASDLEALLLRRFGMNLAQARAYCPDYTDSVSLVRLIEEKQSRHA